MPDVTIAGASYTDVPAVDLPKTGGGTVRFVDVSDTTAVASDVASGKKFYLADGSSATGTASGGGGGYFVKMYDGTNLLNAEIVNGGDMPTYTPSKVGWSFNGWNDSNGNPVTAITEDINLFADYTWNSASALKITGTGLSMTPQSVLNPAGTFEYSLDNGYSWHEAANSVTITGDTIYWRGKNAGALCSVVTGALFVWTGTNISCAGNIYACLNYETTIAGNMPTMNSYAFANFFRGCTGLVSAPTLPATKLATYCYAYMFSGCSALANAPSLPATAMAQYCYEYMFQDCSTITAPPSMTINTTASHCCEHMFDGCSSLTSTPTFKKISLTSSCYSGMFKGCSSLTTAPSLPATTLNTYCYHEMFRDCTSLTAIPTLPSTSLKSNCYNTMFRGCTGVKMSTTQDSVSYPKAYRIPVSGTGSTATNALNNMFQETGGSFTGTPTINTTYYTSNTLVS